MVTSRRFRRTVAICEDLVFHFGFLCLAWNVMDLDGHTFYGKSGIDMSEYRTILTLKDWIE